MPFNLPGLLVPFQMIFNPRIIVPSLTVRDIRQLDFHKLKNAGYRGIVFDKDNCITVPHRDELVPELKDAWKECKAAFGKENVIVVSNTAGSHTDVGGIAAESVSHHLGVPVLHHPSLKPSYSCLDSIRTYFSSLPIPVKDNELVFVGDRVFTDVVLANRMRGSIKHSGTVNEKAGALQGPTSGPLAVLTTGLWKKEAILMRWFEHRLMDAVVRWSQPQVSPKEDMTRFLRDI